MKPRYKLDGFTLHLYVSHRPFKYVVDCDYDYHLTFKSIEVLHVFVSMFSHLYISFYIDISYSNF